ncbi:MAG: hypothetical protein NTY53_08310 [Kiritimatiellaeota bacterium]|nr:hypothetical protein [Kiritimatiellota bacterium]
MKTPVRLPRRLGDLAAALAFGAMIVSAAAGEFSVYHVGNSLTGDLTSKFPKLVTQYEQEQGNTYVWGLHFRAATSLTFIHAHPTDPKSSSCAGIGEKATSHSNKPGAPDKNGPFVPWTVSLPGHHWDAVTLQVWQDNDKATLKRDTEAVNDMIKITRTRPDNATTRFFIYAPWTVSKYGVLDSFSKAYLTPTPDDPDQLGMATRDYFRHVTGAVHKTNPEVALIPAGEVFLALDEKMRAGKFEGLASVQQLHRDQIHLNSIGKNIAAWTAYAVIFKKCPVGLPNNSHLKDSLVPPFQNVAEVSPADLKLIQETIWEVVSSPGLRPYTLVNRKDK